MPSGIFGIQSQSWCIDKNFEGSLIRTFCFTEMVPVVGLGLFALKSGSS
jgi:hypothetical protein